MSLSKHVNAETILTHSKDHRAKSLLMREEPQNISAAGFYSRYNTSTIPKHSMPEKSVDSKAAYQIVHDFLELDGTPNLNLASFVHTRMNTEATQLAVENISKNLIDGDEYPKTQELHQRCVSILADLWHAPDNASAIGTATTGSSEAIQLGGLAMKKRWQEKMKKAGKDIHNPGPNIIMGANAQVALEKFARYFDVESRMVPVSAEKNYVMDPTRAMEFVDENTIGIFVILGSTYTGHYENVLELSEKLDKYQEKTGIDVPIHVDGASGAFVAPFAHPSLKWDFQIPRVVSINASGHKFGLALVGVGWVVFRAKEFLPENLIFELHYLGSVGYTFSLNFSRPAHPIIAQYHAFLNLGKEGYTEIAKADLKNARLLSRALEKSNYFKVLSVIHHPRSNPATSDESDPEHYEAGLPVVSFQFSSDFKKQYPKIAQKWIQTMLRVQGWICPNYELPPNADQEEVLRVVVRESMSEDLVETFLVDLITVTENLMDSSSAMNGLATLDEQNHKASQELADAGMKADFSDEKKASRDEKASKSSNSQDVTLSDHQGFSRAC